MKAAKRIAAAVLAELSGAEPAVVVSEMSPLAAAPISFPEHAQKGAA
jgi:hypothetical protein